MEIFNQRYRKLQVRDFLIDRNDMDNRDIEIIMSHMQSLPLSVNEIEYLNDAERALKVSKDTIELLENIIKKESKCEKEDVLEKSNNTKKAIDAVLGLGIDNIGRGYDISR